MEDAIRFLIIDGDSPRAKNLKSNHWRWNPRPKKTVVALNNENFPVSALRLFNVTLRLSNSPFAEFRAIGIGGVYTREDYRGKGIASRLVNFVTSRIHSDSPSWDVTGFVLYSRPRSIYERCGFYTIGEYRKQTLMYWPIVSSIKVHKSSYWETEPHRF